MARKIADVFLALSGDYAEREGAFRLACAFHAATHDSAEAFIGDIIGPVKATLSGRATLGQMESEINRAMFCSAVNTETELPVEVLRDII